jgi:tRNA A-37 threonylcarbamoyl transferase component Bud32
LVSGLPERYIVVRKIASGGMSEVYLCRLRGVEGFEKKVAVKVIHPRLTEIAHFRDLFIREARIAASLSHQNLVHVFDFGRRGNSYYLAMEFVDGWNLAQAVAQLRVRSIPVPLPLWKYWMEGMLDGIAYLHSRNIVHRDISPSNVLLSRGGAVKITDFGIARGSRLGQVRTEGWEGKFSYMSPEQARGEEGGESSDLFSAGIIAAEFFLPGRLFDGEGNEEILSRVRDHDADSLPLGLFPSPVSEILRKSLAQERTQRFPDASSFARAIGTAVPETISRADHVAFWDLLFPGGGQGEEDTVVVDVPYSIGDAGIIREKKETHAGKGRRGIRIGVMSALVAVTAGGVLLWQGIGPAERGNSSDRVRESSRAVSASSPHVGTSRDPGAVADPAGAVGTPLPEEAKQGRSLPDLQTEVPVTAKAGRTPANAKVPGNTFPTGQGRESFKRVEALHGKRRLVWIETDPAGVTVGYEDGTALGSTPLHLDTAPLSEKKLFFRKKGYVTRSISADALSQLPSFRILLDRRTGKLEVVQAIPWAKVYEGKRYLGVTPIPFLELPVGEHRLRFVNEPLGVDRVETVTVEPGTNPKLIVPLVGTR